MTLVDRLLMGLLRLRRRVGWRLMLVVLRAVMTAWGRRGFVCFACGGTRYSGPRLVIGRSRFFDRRSWDILFFEECCDAFWEFEAGGVYDSEVFGVGD